MIYESLRKAPNRIKGGLVNSKGNHVHRKVMLAAICTLTLVVLCIILGAFNSSKTIVAASSVQGFGVGIYWDQTCTNRTLSINWGPVGVGSNNTLTIYVKNEGNSAVSLWLGTSKWTPSTASTYMSLNWNYSGQVLSTDQVSPLELTLAVSPTINGITDFRFDAIITTTSAS